MPGETIITPRNFFLLDQLEKAEKGQNTFHRGTIGLLQNDDVTLSYWQCNFLGPPNTPISDRIIFLIMHVGANYPREPPTVEFQSKLKYPFIDDSGKLITKELPKEHLLSKWDSESQDSRRIENVLESLSNLVKHPKYHKYANQPAEGETYN